MRILKSNPVLTIFNSYLVDNPEPSTISYLWNFGSLLGLCLVSQIVSGILLAMHYQGSASFAFASVEHMLKYLIIIYAFLSNLSLIKFYYYRNNYSRQDGFSDNTLILDLNKKISNIAPAPRLIE